MAIPAPEVGLVISYGYLWRHELLSGLEEGRKDRPCVIILSVGREGEAQIVTVAAITHSDPVAPNIGIEIPQRVKLHLGLDHEKSWVILSEVNQFTWPGYDLRPIKGSKNKYAYGFLPPLLFEKIKAGVLGLFVEKRAKITSRD